MSATRLGWTASALALLAACGGGQTGMGAFSLNWEDDGGRSIEQVRQRMGAAAIPAGADVAVAVAGHGSKLVGQPLTGFARWSYAHAVDARPVIAGRVVVASGGGSLFALDALTGKELWARPTGGLALRGAGDDGAITVMTMGSATGAGSTLLAVAHDGSVLRQLERPVELGDPAVVGRLAFVPWSNQYVSVLDVADGAEVGRVLLREKTSHAWVTGGALYFGELGMFRFDDKIKGASRGAADHLGLPARTLPGHPLLMRPGEEPTRPIATAGDKIRLYARPTPATAPLALDGGGFYATYYRLALGLSGDRARVAWVHTHPTAFIGGAAAQGSLVLCDVDGKITTLDARTGGQVGDPLDLGEPVESCTVQADEVRMAGAVRDPGPLVQQIRVALTDRDLEIDAGQTLLLRELGSLPDEGATELLVQLATDRRTLPSMLEEVRSALANRRVGARYMIAALERHYDYLRDVVTPPPVGPMARALAAMNEKGAAPALAGHLFDPADGDKDVRDAAQALVVLATPAEAPTLLRFLSLYRDAPSDPEEIPAAVNAVAEALLRVGGPAAKGAIEAAVRDPATNVVVRAKLTALLDASAIQRGAPSTAPSSTSRE